MPPNQNRARTISAAGSTPDEVNKDNPKRLQLYIPRYLRPYVRPYYGDFCVSPYFHTGVLAQLMAEGFFPIACPECVLPKLHKRRCVIDLVQNNLRTPKSVRRKAKRFDLTINTAFDRVVQGCQTQHGDSCWLYPPLVQVFSKLYREGYMAVSPTGHPCPVRLYSIEVWSVSDEGSTPTLAAGELGYTVGSIFTSLTGFSAVDSSGSAQLAALGCLLRQNGFSIWDLGMEMDYKKALGSHLMPRDEFVGRVQAVRCQSNVILNMPTGRLNCREIIDSVKHIALPTTSTKDGKESRVPVPLKKKPNIGRILKGEIVS